MPTKPPQSLYIPAPRLNQFHILQRVAANPHITQAELARQCSLSVAMVNNYMQELCAAGLLEYQRKSSKTISYHLTPAGLDAVSTTMQQLMMEWVKLFGEAKERVREVLRTSANGDLCRVVLYGSGDLAELVFLALDASGVDVVGVCDDDPQKIGHELCGRQVLSVYQMRHLAPDAVVIANSCRANDISQDLSYLSERGIRFIYFKGVEAEDAGKLRQASPPESALPSNALKAD